MMKENEASEFDDSVASISKVNYRDQELLLLNQIKNNAHSPILGFEKEEAAQQRYANLINAFTDLGELYIQKAEALNIQTQDQVKHCIDASKFYNYAINIAKKNQITEAISHEKIVYINVKLQETLGIPYGDPESANKNTKIDKFEVMLIRDFARSEIEQIESLAGIDKIKKTKVLFETIAERMQAFLARLYQESEVILGIPPCNYSIIGLGSMALKTITPYSDLEFAILTESDDYKNNQATKDYFINLTQLVHFRIINLGETVIEASKLGYIVTDHLISKGVSLDLGGKTPLGREDKEYSLIQTREAMMHYLKNEGDEIEHIDKNLPYILEATCFIGGQGAIYTKFSSEVNEFLFDERDSKHKTRVLKRLQEGALEYDDASKTLKRYKGDIEKFSPKLAGADEGKGFDVKENIYRLIDRYIFAIKTFYSVESTNIWEALDILYEQHKFTQEATNNLKYALYYANNLRLKTYLNNGGQIDDMQIFDSQEQLIKSFSFNELDLEENSNLLKYHYIAIALQRKLEIFCKQDSSNDEILSSFFLDSNIYEDSDTCKGFVFNRLAMHSEAIIKLETALANVVRDDAERLSVLDLLGKLYKHAGNLKKSLEFYERYEREHEVVNGQEDSLTLANCFNNLGNIYHELGDLDQAHKNHLKALHIKQRLINNHEYQVAIAISLNNLAQVSETQGKINEAIEFYLQSYELMRMQPKEYQTDYLFIPLLNLGIIYKNRKQFQEAEKAFKDALEIVQKIYKDSVHLNRANVYTNLASFFKNNGDFERAIEYEQKSLDISISFFRNHPNPIVADSLRNFGNIYSLKGIHKISLKYHQESFVMSQKIYGEEENYDIAISLFNIADQHIKLGDFQQAEPLIKDSIRIKRVILMNYPENNKFKLSLAQSIDGLGHIYLYKRDFETAMKLYEESYVIKKEVFFRENDISIANSLNNIGQVLYYQHNYQQSDANFLESYQIKLQVYKEQKDPTIFITLTNYAKSLVMQERFDEALEKLKECESFYESYYHSRKQPLLFGCLGNLGMLYFNRGKYFKKQNQIGKAQASFQESVTTLEEIINSATEVYGSIFHPEVENSFYNLALSLRKLDRHEEAILNIKQAIDIASIIYADTLGHKNIVLSYYELGCIYYDLENLEKAEEIVQKALEIKKMGVCKSNDLDVSSMANHLGIIYLRNGNSVEATKYLEESIAIMRHYSNNRNIMQDLANTLDILSECYKSSDHKRVLEVLVESYQIKEQLNGREENFAMAEAANNLAWAYENLHEYEKAVFYYEKAISINHSNISFKQMVHRNILQASYFLANHYYQENDLFSTIQEYEKVEGLDRDNEYKVKELILHNLACMYNAAAIQAKTNDDSQSFIVYAEKADLTFTEALRVTVPNAALFTEYANFLIENARYSEAAEYLIKAIKIGSVDSQLCYGAIEKNTISNSIRPIIDKNGEVRINAIEYAHYLLVHNFDELADASSLKAKEELLQDFRTAISSYLGHYLYAATQAKNGINNDNFLFTEVGLELLKSAELLLNKDAFNAFINFCNSKEVYEQNLSEQDYQQINVLLNLILDGDRTEENRKDQNLHSGIEINPEMVDKISGFVGKSNLENNAGFYSYIFNSLASNIFTSSAKQVLQMVNSLIDNLEFLFSLPEGMDVNDSATSIWTQLEYLLEFTASGQRFVGFGAPPFFDPDLGDYSGGGGGGNDGEGDHHGGNYENPTIALPFSSAAAVSNITIIGNVSSAEL